MRSSIGFTAALAASAEAYNPFRSHKVAARDTCVSGLYMLVARGTGEAQGLGYTSLITQQIANKIPGSEAVAVVYPATFDKYEISEGTGAANAKQDIENYVAMCPEAKIALLGYSQGAEIMMDVVCGGSGGFFNNDTALSSSIMDKNVVAVTVFGDPTYVVGEPYDVGTANHDGIFERNNTATCREYTSKLRSYCDIGDVYCDSGTNVSVHGSYFRVYGAQIADFIVNHYNDFNNSNSNSSNSTSSTMASTAASTAASTSGTMMMMSSGSATATPTGTSGSGSGSGSGSSTTSSAGSAATSPHSGAVKISGGLLAALPVVMAALL